MWIMAEDKQELIDQFHKSSVEVIAINLNEWRSQLYVDIRIWILENPAEPGSMKPSHKGIRLSADLLPKLTQALKKAQEALNAAEKV